MTYQFPPDVDQLVRDQMAHGRYGSEDEVLRVALQALTALNVRGEELLRDVRTGLEQAERGLAQTLDVDGLIDRCVLKLSQEGIRD